MILDEIAAKRRIQLAREMEAVPEREIIARAKAAPATRGFADSLRGAGLSVIAEVKKASPSKGVICEDFHPAQIAAAYEQAGANALSVLTEEAYFQGSSRYLTEIRAATRLPILRKDFILHPYQIYEARAIGADAILLIAALLDTAALRDFTALAESLGLDCLMEAHNETELESALSAGGAIVGINNRDLHTFSVSLDTTRRLAPKVRDRILVSESGIASNADMREAAACGADAVLIGETLMRSGDVGTVLRSLREGC